MDLTTPLATLPRRSAPIRLLTAVAAAALIVLSLPSPAAAGPVPTVKISNVTVTETTGSPATASFTIQVAPRPRACCPLQVSWATAPGTATAPADFTASSGTVSLSRAVSTRVVTVPVVGDLAQEAAETFVVNLTDLAGSPGKIGDAQGVATIVDDDLAPTLSVDDVSVTEGNAGSSTASFTASLSGTSVNAVTFDWSTIPGSADAGADYVAASGTGTIVAGSASVGIDVTVSGDTKDEVDETFGLSLFNAANATIVDASGLATIVDEDPVPLLAIGDASVVEGDAGTTTMTFDVVLSAASGKQVTVAWATGDDGATQPADYLAGSGTLTFAPGDTTESVGVTVNGDAIAELDDTFHVTLSDPTNAALGDARGIGTITDDELQPVIDIDEPTIAEDGGSLTFSVTLSHQSGSTVTVDWTTAAGTAQVGTDYLGDAGTVTFAPLDTSETVSLAVTADGTYEHDETLSLDLSNAAGAPIGDLQGVGTIANDDAAPTLSVSDVSALEGNAGQSALSFAVSLTGDTAVDASVGFATSNGTAAAGSDYVAAAGTLTIPAGQSDGTIDVVVNGDLMHEANQAFSLTLTDPVDALVADGLAVGTIRNDDKAPTTVTLRLRKKPTTLVATGILEPAKTGFRVTATLFRSRSGHLVKLAAKSVRVRYLRDRDGDGKRDGSYTATFLRPKAQGTYKILVRFTGTATHEACSRARVFTLAAT